ncbi:MAG: hypothetical protein OIF38_09765 [Cellvibrionaceae bacterium]|nr:hypothetical protein [Cellvibrionaceae bacterium]
MAKGITKALGLLLLGCGAMALALVWCWYDYRQQLAGVLAQALPQEAAKLYTDSGRPEDFKASFFQQFNRGLSQYPAPAPAYLKQCRPRLLSLDGQAQHWRQLALSWRLAGQPRQAVFGLNCQPDYLALLGRPGLLSILAGLLLMALPRPLSSAQRRLLGQLLGPRPRLLNSIKAVATLGALSPVQRQLLGALLAEPGSSPKQCLALVAKPQLAALAPQQIPWFVLGWRHSGGDWQRALAVALAEPGLRFAATEALLWVHGIPLAMAKTPFIYYRWYAQQRSSEGGGWVINPASNQADINRAAELVALMHDYGGHKRALGDLQQRGLRAKTLDQNRNKIKDELQALLGEELAAPYLFSHDRDQKSGRGRYRLSLSPALIEIVEP